MYKGNLALNNLLKTNRSKPINLFIGNKLYTSYGGARGLMVIVVGIGHGDTSSNPGPDWLHFTVH